MFDFEVKIAQTQSEMSDAFKLRHEVFDIEMGSDSDSKRNQAQETDEYDKFCDHLIVIDRTKSKTVGTYRLLLGSRADKRLGFYAEKIFDIQNIKRLTPEHEILELGRSCIDKDYRTRPVINLLWSGIADYIKDKKVGYLFGSARLSSYEPQEVSKVFKFIREKFYTPDALRVYPWPANKFKGLDGTVAADNPRQILRSLPPLVKGYLRIGGMVCSEPAMDLHLYSAVIFILLDTKKIPEAYRQHFL